MAPALPGGGQLPALHTSSLSLSPGPGHDYCCCHYSRASRSTGRPRGSSVLPQATRLAGSRRAGLCASAGCLLPEEQRAHQPFSRSPPRFQTPGPAGGLPVHSQALMGNECENQVHSSVLPNGRRGDIFWRPSAKNKQTKKNTVKINEDKHMCFFCSVDVNNAARPEGQQAGGSGCVPASSSSPR